MAKDKAQKSRAASRPGDWTDVLAPRVLSQFVGKHIAIVHKKVVASGTSYSSVLQRAESLYPDETPYLAYIPTPEESTSEDSAAVASHIGQYSGMHVAIVDKNIVAYGPVRETVQEESLKLYPGIVPDLFYIPSQDEPADSQVMELMVSITAGNGSTNSSNR